jgi:CheY-like chemotaxis protein
MQKINCILLVDDNPADNEYHSIMIREADVCENIQIATDGEKALAYIKRSGEPGGPPKPDIIYLDINMPRMNGFEFLDEYSKLDERLKSKGVIIMLTTSLNPDDYKKASSYKEVARFENKPLSVEMIKTTVGEYF